MNIRLKNKHWELGRHFESFVDRRWHPGFVLDSNNLSLFIKYESYGIRSLNSEELQIIAPLLNAKINYELTIKMIYEECAEYWSSGFGWRAPIAHTINSLFQSRCKRSPVYIKALIKIMRVMKQDFIEALVNYTGLDGEVKDRYLQRYIQFKQE